VSTQQRVHGCLQVQMSERQWLLDTASHRLTRLSIARANKQSDP